MVLTVAGVRIFDVVSSIPEDCIKQRAMADMDAIADTISDFRERTRHLPTQAELKELALIQRRTPDANHEITPGGTRIGEMIDPFARPYFYTRFSDSDGFLLKSSGRDGKESSDDYIWHAN
jgi:hypothetical protein